MLCLFVGVFWPVAVYRKMLKLLMGATAAAPVAIQRLPTTPRATRGRSHLGGPRYPA